MARLVIVCFGIAIISLLCIFLAYMAYWDALIKRDKEFQQAVKAMQTCDQSELVMEAGLNDFCEQRKETLEKSPRLQAVRDVVCRIMPCTLFGKDRSESIIRVLFDNISDTSIKILIILLFLYVIGVLCGWIRPTMRELPPIMLPVYTSPASKDMSSDIPMNKRNSFSTVHQRNTSQNFKYD